MQIRIFHEKLIGFGDLFLANFFTKTYNFSLQDFATRSLSDRNLTIINESQMAKDKEDDLVPFKIRRSWEKRLVIFFEVAISNSKTLVYSTSDTVVISIYARHEIACQATDQVFLA